MPKPRPSGPHIRIQEKELRACPSPNYGRRSMSLGWSPRRSPATFALPSEPSSAQDGAVKLRGAWGTRCRALSRGREFPSCVRHGRLWGSAMRPKTMSVIWLMRISAPQRQIDHFLRKKWRIRGYFWVFDRRTSEAHRTFEKNLAFR